MVQMVKNLPAMQKTRLEDRIYETRTRVIKTELDVSMDPL